MILGDPALPREISAYPRLITRLYDLFRKLEAYLDFQSLPRWDDLRFPAQGINPAGPGDTATIDASTKYGTLLFSGSVDNYISGIAQMPHSWQEGTGVFPHIHWTKPAADGPGSAVTWEFIYAYAPIGTAIEAYSAWQSGTQTIGNLTDAEVHNVTTFPEIDMTDRVISCCLLWGLVRRGSTDAYAGTARLLELDFHYLADSKGSLLEYQKV